MVERKHAVFDRFHLPDTKPTPEGEEFEILNSIETDPESGYQRLVPTGEKRPIQKCINAAAGIGVMDLDEAFRRYVSGEDVNLIVRKSDTYADVSEFSGDALDTYLSVREYVGNNIIIESAAVSDTAAANDGGSET